LPKHKVPRFRRGGATIKMPWQRADQKTEMMPMMICEALSQEILGSGQPLGHRMCVAPIAPLLPTPMTTCVGRCSWLIYTLNLRHNFIYRLLLGRTQRAARPKVVLWSWSLGCLVVGPTEICGISVYETKAKIYCCEGVAAGIYWLPPQRQKQPAEVASVRRCNASLISLQIYF